jgi:hypothetical protein
MLGWKYLRLFGLLSLYCFANVKADNLTALPDCTVPENADGTKCTSTTEFTADTYCKTPDGKIYKSTTTSPSCKTAETADSSNPINGGYVLFDCGESKCDKLSDLTNGPTGNLLVYHCEYANNACTWTPNKVSYYSSNSKLYQCSGTAPCTGITTGIFYLTSANSNESDNKLVSVTSGSSSDLTITAVGKSYCLDGESLSGTASSKLIACTKADANTAATCEAGQTASAGLYINGNADTSTKTTKALISCTASGTDVTCTEINATENRYYANAGTKGLIKCDSSTGCADVTGPSTSGYYLDESSVESTKYKSLISCSTNGQNVECSSSPAGEGVFVDASTATGTDPSIKYTSIITCTNVSNVIECSSTAVSAAAVYINGAGDKTIINCTASSCTVEATEGVYLDAGSAATPATDPASYTKLITCATNNDKVECDSDTVTSGAYLDKSTYTAADAAQSIAEKYGSVITCTSSGCTSTAGVAGAVYLNSGVDNAAKPIIKCSAASTCNSDATAGVYLDAGSVVDPTQTSLTYKNLITCTKSGTNTVQCSSNPGVAGVYLDGSVQDATGATTKLISCVAGTAATDPTTCNNTLTPADGATYINKAVTSGLTNALIKCATPTGGSLTCTADTAKNEQYYLNSDTNVQLIKCTTDEGCQDVTVTTAGHYLDGNTFTEGVNGAAGTYTNIIDCTGTGTITCVNPTTALTEGNIFVNAAVTTGLEGALIKCTGSTTTRRADPANPTVTCTKESGDNKGYYLNSGSDKTSNPLIKCTDKCVTAVAEVTTGVYLDYGSKESSDKFAKLITCTATTTCDNTTVTAVKGYYINEDSKVAATPTTPPTKRSTVTATFSGLITCDKNLKCGLFDTPTAGFYINANPGSTKLTKSLIQCTGEGESIACELKDLNATKDANSVFINNDTNKLIQCKDDTEGCKEFASTGTSTVPAFYVNGGKAGSFAPAAARRDETVNYADLLIRCTDAECVLAEAGEFKVYLNANLKDTSDRAATPVTNSYSTDEKQLIICYDGKCETLADTATTTNYYINGGVDSDATDKTKSALIKCTSGTPVTCSTGDATLATGVTENFYINANASKDTQNYLIKCTSNGCEPYKKDPSSSSGTTEYYVHGEPNATTKLTDAVIKCEITTSAACTPVAATNLDVYIDSYNVNNIIRCFTTPGCTSVLNSSTRTTSAYYVSKETSGSLIKCYNDTGCVEVTLDELTAVEGKKVFLNANFGENADAEKHLIKCDATGACSLAASAATATNPEFYVNADTNKENKDYDGATKTEIIKCIADADGKKTCDTNLTTKENDVFINANFDSNTPLQIIVCSNEDCIEKAAFAEGETATTVYYVNAGATSSEKLTDTLIKCSSSACEPAQAEPKDIYINALDKQLIICKDASTGCMAVPSTATNEKYQYFLNSSDLKTTGQEVLTDDLIKCSADVNNTRICEPAKGEDKKVYINSFDKSTVISCVSGTGCSATNSTAEENKPQFFVNGGDIPNGDKLKLDLIKCSFKKSSGKADSEGSISCDTTNGKEGDVYLNGNSNDASNQLIICSEDDGCVATAVTLGDGSATPSGTPSVTTSATAAATTPARKRSDPSTTTTTTTTTATSTTTPTSEQSSSSPAPNYYINSGNEGKDKFEYALIQCANGEGDAVICDLYKADQYQVYVNSNAIDNAKVPLIKCAKNACSKTASAATETSKEYYINSGDIDETPKNYDIIECALDGDTVKCTCKAEADTNDGVYVNSNYSESGDNKQLIQCSSDNGCVGMATAEKGVEYYVNAESANLTNAIIFCSNKKCEKQTPAAVPMYYIGKDGDNVDGLIKCVKSTPPPAERRRKRGDDEEKCTLTSAFTSEGYYLNSGYNKSTNQTIICDSTEGCSTVKVDLGYYVNAGNDEKKIIKCEKEGSECEEEDTKSCPLAEKAVPGNYCYEDGQLKFFTANNSTAITASKSDDTYAFATIPSNGFPGVKSETGSLFKISRYFINRFYQSGVIMIDKNGKLVDSLGGDTSDISLYDCNESTKVCAERPGCTSNTYMFDSENRKAVFCNDGNLEYASFTGYVVDGNRVTSGTKHPYIIQCENGENCVSLKPKSSTYYENSGYDSTTNSLIQCNNSNCMTVAADVGYYVAHGHIDNNGVIKCTTATSCSYSQVKNKVKYVNAGFDKRNNAIIECKGGKCNVAKAKSGYYLTHTSTLLIQCTSPTSCAEFTPTVNYYDNADSSESSNTIINCVQNSNVVTCSSEATNNGFYMSSLSNVLIRCKAGHKCKAITVKNGIFRGALKGLTSNKRSDNTQNVQNVHGRDDDDLEEDGKMVNLRDNSDDAYGIIRCVAGKCAALSASELAAIPMCEFNNNKCYITLEYAMTKSATTSIAAGNICTNSDRSVFYFATDTVVVKPNVISGVTSTYVYTTTNSNCLEVNDSYNDMYFTVGSNIYTLDQGSVLQFYETGYYFLNVAKNTLVGGNEIDAYNDENVKLYRCNGSSCSIIDKPDANTYYADVNKRILKYNVNNDVFTFAYEKDIICIFANNKCTPNADLKNQEFCITYKGEIVLATTDIKNRETGECYRAGNINNYIYGYSQHLYHMNQFAAEMVDQTGFYIISLSTNTTVVSKNYKNKNNSIVVYGCNLSSCRVYEPDEDTYYYDAQARNILRYKNGVWSSPSTSGYAYIAIDPTNTYVYKFVKKGDEIIIQGKANYGYYYTVDNEMYHCDQEDGECKPIDETGYYFTNAGEVFSCVHDSEGLEATECVKQNCVSGQYYYIDDAYYRCEVSSLLVPVVSRYCSYDDNVVVNFPLALTEEFPDKIKQAVDDIQRNNNSTAVVTRRGKNYLEAVSGIFTNCTYNVEETKSTFDLVCVNNYVKVDEETDEMKICNVDQLGYVECIEDEENPEKCTVSGANALLKPSIILLAIGMVLSILFSSF